MSSQDIETEEHKRVSDKMVIWSESEMRAHINEDEKASNHWSMQYQIWDI